VVVRQWETLSSYSYKNSSSLIVTMPKHVALVFTIKNKEFFVSI
jgi:hypothetical protein